MPSRLAARRAETGTPVLVKSAAVSAEHKALPEDGLTGVADCAPASGPITKTSAQTAAAKTEKFLGFMDDYFILLVPGGGVEPPRGVTLGRF